VIDPIPEIAALAQSQRLLFHVDACVGGLHLTMMRKSGYPIPDFDFSLPGVTSISVDMHKFGYAAKNISVVLFHSRELRRFAYFSNSETTGYAVINTTVLSSKSGGPMAGAWAVLNYLGEDGYLEIIAEVTRASRAMMAGVRAIPELRVLGEPDMCMFAIASDSINVFELDDEMSRRGWNLQPQFSAPGSPPNLHVSVNRSNVEHVEAFLEDLRDSVKSLLNDSHGVGDTTALKTEVLRLMSAPGTDTFAQIAALAGMTPGLMPTGFGRINTVLDALPRPIVDALLIEYMNSLYA
jgi:glutamate/tyrosine decarboxylase-like PLP-dependent enzyme